MRAPVHDLHVSNLLTYVSLLAGVAALAAVLERLPVAIAGVALTTAVVADTFDGRWARRFDRSARQARIGHELDGLVDAVVFGLVPVAMLGASRAPSMLPTAVLWWVAAGFYVLAVVTRLAFYGVEHDDTRFVGIPTPAAALVCVTALFVPAPASLAYWPLLMSAVLMVAPVSIPRPRGLALGVFVAWALVLLLGLTAQAIV